MRRFVRTLRQDIEAVLAPWRSSTRVGDENDQSSSDQEAPVAPRVKTLDPMTGRQISPLTAAALCVKPRGQMTRHAGDRDPASERCPLSGMMRGETRDAGHSARVRRADRMRFRSLSESVELQSDRHSRRWSFCRSYNRQSTPTAIGRCARDVDQQNRHEASSLGSHADL
jgi:hypothetical protein